MSSSAPHSAWSRRGRRLGALVLSATLLGSAAWASLAPISGAVVARGTFVVQGERQKVQYRDGGRIAKIHVALGDAVAAGQLLVSFDVPELVVRRSQLNSSQAALKKRQRLIADELAGVRKLYDVGLVAKPRYIALERDKVQVEAELEDARLKLQEVDIQLGNAELRSPSAGRVVELAYTAPGSVVRSGEKIMELLPLDARLLIDARIDQQQVHNVAHDAVVEVRLSGLNQKTTPTIRGRVGYVSADALTDERTTARYFQVRVAVADADIARYKLSAGLPAEVMIETAPRSVLDYVLKPLGDSLARTMREPI